ncbi:MAG: metallopeptidase TldD-related protein [Thermoplasmata archaeon]|nr:metallopeptidase TldD-related protein [Thermoplasmata archaeon]
MSEEQDLLDLASSALEQLPTGWKGDVRVLAERWGTMRFAVGRLHQPHLEEGHYLSFRAVHDHRVGIAATSDISPQGIRRVAAAARALARVAPPDEKFPAFPAPGAPPPTVAFSRATARLTPEAQVRLAEEALAGARSVQPEGRIAGAVNVGTEVRAVANSSGLAVVAPRSVVQMSVLVDRPDLPVQVSGWDEGAHWDVQQLDAAELGRAAAERVPTTALESAAPGRYRVLLDGPAAAELIGFLGHLGFNSRAEEEGWSCLRHRRGRRVAPEFVNLTDDGTSPRSVPQSFDYEGIAKRRIRLLDHGIAQPAAADLRGAAAKGIPPTGHGPLPESPWGDWGASPTNVLLRPGSSSFDDLLAAVGEGILVTRFNYVRVVHPARSIITGMTRDGTYRIHRGRLGAPVRNFRFTESVLGAVRSIEALGRATRRYSDERGGASVSTPALVAGAFRFTSATLF